VKKVISIALILLLSAQCFYKLGVISYYQLNQNYIAEVLCINKEKPISMCHGKCFLKRNLHLGEETQKIPASAGKEKIEITFFLISQCCRLSGASSSPAAMNSPYLKIYNSDYTSGTFHPPQLA
jgi:hypothetical protein